MMSGAHCGSALKSESMKSLRCDEGSLRFRPVDREEGSIDSGTVVGGILWVSPRFRDRGLMWVGGGIGSRVHRWLRRYGAGGTATSPCPDAQHQGCRDERESSDQHDDGHDRVTCFQAHRGHVRVELEFLSRREVHRDDMVLT